MVSKEKETEEVPIIFGAKYTGTFGRTTLGLLSCYTDSILSEPKTLYSVGRVKLGILKNSEIGVLYGEARDEVDKQRVGGIDMTFRTTELQIQSQYAHSDSRDAIISNFHWYTRKFILLGQYMKCDTLFDVGRIGFVPWRGITKYSFVGGPQWFNKSIFRSLSIGIGVINEKEDGEPKSGYGIMCKLFFNFVNNWGSSTNFITGKDYEMDRYYDYYKIQSMFWSDYSKPVVTEANLSYTSYGYNYNRGYFGSMSQNSLSIEYRVSPPLSVSCDIVNSMEWSPEDTTIITWVGRPILQYAITKDMHIRIYTEPNPETKIHQFNLLFSYNFRPKSWFYIALNETRDNQQGKMRLSKRIGIIKLRYLFFF